MPRALTRCSFVKALTHGSRSIWIALAIVGALVLQTAYSELKRKAQAQGEVLAGTPGSLTVRTVKGRRFVYRQFYGPDGKKLSEYVGPEDEPRTVERAAALRDVIAGHGGRDAEAAEEYLRDLHQQGRYARDVY